MNQKKIVFSFLILISIFILGEARGEYSFFNQPRLVFGGSAGFYRTSLDDFTRIYDSRWDYFYSGQISLRVYRANYLTLQYGRFRTTGKIDREISSNEAEWDERFINLGIRWYAESQKRLRLYSGFGFTFVTVEEQVGLSLLAPENPNAVSKDGKGFFLEVGGDYLILSHLALNLEIEISSASHGGSPGFMGSSLGGYAFLAGVNFHF